LFGLVVVAAIATWFLPAGEYARREVAGRKLVDASSYSELPRSPAGVAEVFLAFPRGLQATASIVFFIFLIGGTFGVLQATGALDAGIGAIVAGAQGRAELVLPLLVFVFALGGGTIGMAEETLPFLPGLVILCRRLGYDEVIAGAIALQFLPAPSNTALASRETGATRQNGDQPERSDSSILPVQVSVWPAEAESWAQPVHYFVSERAPGWAPLVTVVPPGASPLRHRSCVRKRRADWRARDAERGRAAVGGRDEDASNEHGRSNECGSTDAAVCVRRGRADGADRTSAAERRRHLLRLPNVDDSVQP
jgi:hypothetical protein